MKAKKIIGWVLVSLVAAMMLFAGGAKVSGQIPMEEVEKMGLADEIKLIGAGAIVSALLLVFPKTTSLGVLLVSAYWGGAICSHMIRGDSYAIPAALLITTWIGVALRDDRACWSFCPCGREDVDSVP